MNETRNCQNCKKDFNIEPDDFSFYEKMKVPPPTWCPRCRFMRRVSFMNIYSLYKDICDKCGENIISMFNKNNEKKVYCSKCWWADDWDGTEYAMDYDPSKTFFEQFTELQKRTPNMALDTLYSSLVNTNYLNYASYLKNCYGIFFADYAENAYYCDFLNTIKDCSDCYRIRDSELCFDSVGMYKCYGCISSDECDNSVNLLFCKSCSGCTDCFGCMNLKKQSYCIYNKQYTKEEYFEFIKNANLNSYINYVNYLQKAKTFWLDYPVRSMYGNSLNVNVSGDYIYESKNTKDSYMVTSAEDSRYIQLISVASTKDAYDYTCWGGNAEKIYESLIAGHGSSEIKFCMAAYPDCMNTEYGYYTATCKNIFGCANLKRKSYCILNKEYSKEEFEILKNKIISEMNSNPYIDSNKRVYKYGEFFPQIANSFAYNETFAQIIFPITKEEAMNNGYKWNEIPPNEYNPTISYSDLPDISSDREYILKQVIKCSCGRCYKIVEGELDIIFKLGMPIPRYCVECRRDKKFKRALPPVIYSRNCAKCGLNINTSYSPDRPEIVYCESCYQKEVN